MALRLRSPLCEQPKTQHIDLNGRASQSDRRIFGPVSRSDAGQNRGVSGAYRCLSSTEKAQCDRSSSQVTVGSEKRSQVICLERKDPTTSRRASRAEEPDATRTRKIGLPG